MTRGMALTLALVILVFAFFTAWYANQRTDYFPQRLQTTFARCEMAFGDVIERDQVMDDFEDAWFSGELSAFQEPSLYARPELSPRSIRFTWLPSFHDPVVVRLDEGPDGRLVMTAKQRPGGQGFSTGGGVKRSRQIRRVLDANEAIAIRGLVERTQLFEAQPIGCSGFTDGAMWIVEGSDPLKGYRYRAFQSLDEGLERELGGHLLALTGWRLDAVY